MDEIALRAPDDVETFCRRWLPQGDPRAIVLAAHGLSEHSGRYVRLAGVLTEQEYAVYAPDHRGHGRTSASTGIGRAGPSGIDGLVDDLGRVEQRAREDNPGLPIVLFGHSMGALLALAYAERAGGGLTGLALSGSPGVAEDLPATIDAMQGAIDAGLGDEPIQMLAAFNESFEPARTSYDWLSRDAAEVDAYIADPHCPPEHAPTYGFLAGMMRLAVDSTSAERIAALRPDLPILLMTGAADPVSRNGANVRTLEKRLRDAGLNVDAIYYEDARHEILNETNRDEVHTDLVGWLHRVLVEP